MPMHHKFISVRTPKPVKRFIRKDTVSFMRRECSANWYEIGNGNSGCGFQLVQAVRHSVVRLADTSETYKHSPAFRHCESTRFSASDWGKGDIPARKFSIGGVHFDELGGRAEEIETRSLLQRRKLLPTELTFKVASTDLEMESRATRLSSRPFAKL